MIIPNGTIQLRIEDKGRTGLDPDTGYPYTPSSEAVWSAPIPCQYRAVSYNGIALVLGERRTLATYSILIEEQPLPRGAAIILLKDSSGQEIGEFPVLRTEPIEAVQQLRVYI